MNGKELQDHIEKSVVYRGRILHEMSKMEVVLNLYLSLHFCGGNQQAITDMQLFILGDDRMSLYSKAQVFKLISTNYDKEWFKAYKSTRPKLPKNPDYNIYKDLIHVIEHRNVFAHKALESNIMGKTKPGNVVFLKLKDETNFLEYDDDILTNLVLLIRNIVEHLRVSPKMIAFFGH